MKDVVEDRPSLSDLATVYGSDKGPSKHRYTELYDMLFRPFRDADIRFLEMGLGVLSAFAFRWLLYHLGFALAATSFGDQRHHQNSAFVPGLCKEPSVFTQRSTS